MSVIRLLEMNRRQLQRFMGHRFYADLIAGELLHAQLALYLAQDNLYLAAFASTLNGLLNLINDEGRRSLLSRHKRDTLNTIERQRAFVEGALGLSGVLTQAARPVTEAYSSHLESSVCCGFNVGLSSILPCYVFYTAAVLELLRFGSKDHILDSWIKGVAGASDTLKYKMEMVEIYDNLLIVETETAECSEAFAVSCNFEVQFLDMIVDRFQPQID